MVDQSRSFGQVIHTRRRQLGLTKQEIARQIKTSTPYVGHLENGRRRPSEKVLLRLARVLGLDRREMFFVANPQAMELSPPKRCDR
jgi:transcriptional regulator with XRE-family HTH domain